LEEEYNLYSSSGEEYDLYSSPIEEYNLCFSSTPNENELITEIKKIYEKNNN
jgi:hypothetical protein